MISKERFEEILQSYSKVRNIAVLGDVGVDKYTAGRVDRISPEAPVPVVRVEKEWVKLGLAANVSDNFSELGIKTTLCGVIGDDQHAHVFEELLEDRNLSTWGLVRSKERATTFKERIVAGGQQICRVDYETVDATDAESKAALISRLKEFANDIDALIIEDYAKGLFDKELTQEVIKIFKDQGKLVCVDPSRSSNPMIYKGADLFKPNLKEAKLVLKSLGLDENLSAEKMCEALMKELDLSQVVITLGAQGMISLDKKSGACKRIPTMAKDVFDVSGAGDTSIALLCASLVAGASLEEASVMANIGAGIVVGKRGTATVSRQEMKEYFAKYIVS